MLSFSGDHKHAKVSLTPCETLVTIKKFVQFLIISEFFKYLMRLRNCSERCHGIEKRFTQMFQILQLMFLCVATLS